MSGPSDAAPTEAGGSKTKSHEEQTAQDTGIIEEEIPSLYE
jgi:hypothetical protein